MKRFLVCCVVFISTSGLSSAFYTHILKNGFGSSDLLPLIFWGTPGALVACLILSSVIPSFSRFRVWIKWAGLILLAIVTAIVAPLSLLMLGPWLGALSIAPLPGTLAGSLASVWILGQDSPVSRVSKWVQSCFIILATSFVLGVGLEPFLNGVKSRVFGGETVRVVSARVDSEGAVLDKKKLTNFYCPDNTPPVADAEFKPFKYNPGAPPEPRRNSPMNMCHERILARLLAFHDEYKITRPLKISRTGRYLNYRSESQIILVFQERYRLPAPSIKLFLPDHDAMIYAQNGDQWIAFPENARRSSRSLIFSTAKMIDRGVQKDILCIAIEDIGGRTQGSSCGIEPYGTRIYSSDSPQ